MILPIVAYGDPVLRKETEAITKDYPNLDTVIENMFETMYEARGIGLAAPQVNLPIRLFIVDATPFEDDEDLSEEEQQFVSTFKKVFINARIIEETGDEWAFNEGCLSIPDVREDVFRKPNIVMEYEDENFNKHKESFSGIVARIIQHEYDHIEGILFTDKLSPLKKRLIKSKLANISKGKVGIDYKMKFPNAKKKR
ncbi:peptide deformylase [Aequorivita vladivostokensis]|uniref:Peptide deformylase n=1 Tax=Aequorivita vladivostokensis TaxID=171194 RepID=A0ABR5DK60_9FLAO|nr:peptide deformylase [Aequorivita vladivostokensis]KJJ39159.1 peptide deformylase [Aequorivita vladivostokensis]